MKILKFPKTRTQKSNQPQNRKQKVAFQFGKPQKILPGFHEVWEVTDTSLLPQSHFIKPTTLEVNDDEDNSAPLNPNDSPKKNNSSQQHPDIKSKEREKERTFFLLGKNEKNKTQKLKLLGGEIYQFNN